MAMNRLTTQARSPWGLLNQLDDVNALFDRFGGFDRRFDRDAGELTTDWMPAVDIREEPNRFVLRADVPGVDAKDIEITMENGTLTIRGHRQEIKEDEHDGFRRRERLHGEFFRRFMLPDSADAESIQAQSKNGVLEVVIPKEEKVQPRRIEVKG